jgi:phosphotransferase system IIA component
VTEGDQVNVGDPLIDFDREAITAARLNPETYVVITNTASHTLSPIASGNVRAGDQVLTLTVENEVTNA